MGRRQTETTYQSEAAYPKSVLLWLQEYWTGPAPRFYTYKQHAQGPRHYAAQSANAGLDKQDVVVDLPPFLPPRKSPVHRTGAGSEPWQRTKTRSRYLNG
jgi:hypothetical protein